MAKRTMKQIENDFTVSRNFVKDNPSITSVKEIAVGVGLTESQVRTSLERHPRVYSKIKQLIDENIEKVKAQKLAEKEAIEAKKKAEKEARKAKKEAEKAELEAKKKAKNEALKAKKAKDEAEAKVSQPTKANEETDTAQPVTKKTQVQFVIDASITGVENLHDILNKILSTKAKIILTSITIQELDKMQRFNDTDGNDARRILGMAAANLEDFHCVCIDETAGTPDDCIIKYCADNKENVVLLTSDKTMALTARTFGVKTHFLKQTKNNTSSVKSNFIHNKTGSRTNTLYAARRIGGKLFISDFTTPYRSILVLSNGIEYNDGVRELKVGDDVYLATKKDGYLTFAHYCITSLGAEDNCKLVFSKRIYDVTEITDLPVANYKSFMREFNRRVNF
jgi:rRNA-processing protein FCF1